MKTIDDDICARDGCGWSVALELVANMALPTTHCSEACRDFDYLRRGLDAMERTPDVDALYANLRAVADVLNARTDPTDVGALPGVWDA
ncbi:hypothetical protein K388_00310 [Streptomyces sp. KhCrAH-43]|uniref:hypothetical protein n=1 Tax=unclassified Streptomyces TaxID=2593676 RepID=UPI0003654E3B|nr:MULTISPECIES: hypothetical protein [unclassified Streptomyces]MYS37900.1 hypothetical protein [Streptomyces sp. SID4920]MYX66087.1 hypothetical protein [Streptomyces sp. SID8373]RAJ67570.1 hypothetical protein K388_00310 [Streptomyces sp. KhCrAH-43]